MPVKDEVQNVIIGCVANLKNVDMTNEYKAIPVRLGIIEEALNKVEQIHRRNKSGLVNKLYKRIFKN